MRASRWFPVLLITGFGSLHAQAKAPTAADFLSPASPLEVGAAEKADVVAWVSYERGMRNIYVARAPDWKPFRITRFLDDDGVDVGGVRLSDDGAMAGALVIGVGQEWSTLIIPSMYKEAIAFSAMALCLMFRPRGLWG